jgi:Phosphodiester glycosidase
MMHRLPEQVVQYSPQQIARFSTLITMLSILSGCFSSTLPSNSTSNPILPTATSETWETLALGLERRTYTPPNNAFGTLIVLRIEPALYTFRAHYRPQAALTLAGWREALPNATAFVNANYFDPQGNALGLVVSDGVVYGQSLVNMGGMLQVQGGVPRVRSTRIEPYMGEALEQAVQAFPMLVTNEATVFTDWQGDRISRRTVVAQDAQGRILLMATPLIGISLVDLAAYLPTTDLGIVSALNLDGGGSTMLSIAAGAQPYTLNSFDAVPTILAVYPR